MRKLIIVLLFISSFNIALASDNWFEAKSDHFIIHYRNAPERFIDKLIDEAEYAYDRIAEDLGFQRYDFWLWDNRAQIYVYDDAKDYQASTGLPSWSQGAAVYAKKIIYTFPDQRNFFEKTLPHEMSHIIFREFVGFNNQAVPLWLDEGVASLYDKSQRFTSKNIVKDAIKKGAFIELARLSNMNPLAMNDKNSVDLFYAESINVVDYLMDKFGRDSFVLFCQTLRDKKDLDAAIRYAYPFSDLSELEEGWKHNLK